MHKCYDIIRNASTKVKTTWQKLNFSICTTPRRMTEQNKIEKGRIGKRLLMNDKLTAKLNTEDHNSVEEIIESKKQSSKDYFHERYMQWTGEGV